MQVTKEDIYRTRHPNEVIVSQRGSPQPRGLNLEQHRICASPGSAWIGYLIKRTEIRYNCMTHVTNTTT